MVPHTYTHTGYTAVSTLEEDELSLEEANTHSSNDYTGSERSKQQAHDVVYPSLDVTHSKQECIDNEDKENASERELQVLVNARRWKYFPVSNFGVPLGFAAQSSMLRVLSMQEWTQTSLQPFLHFISLSCFLISMTLWLCFTAIYTYKLFYVYPAVSAEFWTPSRNPFFFAPLLGIMALTLSLPSKSFSENISTPVFFICGVAQFLGSWVAISTWLWSWPCMEFQNGQRGKGRKWHVFPTYLMTTVGFILNALVGYNAGYHTLPFFSLSHGIFLYLTTLLLNIFKMAPESRNQPTICLHLAPPSLIAHAIHMHTGDFGIFSQVFFYLTLFIFVLVIPQTIRIFLQTGPSSSLWAVTFPAANLAVASIFWSSSSENVDLTSYTHVIPVFLCVFSLCAVVLLSVMSLMPPGLLFSDVLIDDRIRHLRNLLGAFSGKIDEENVSSYVGLTHDTRGTLSLTQVEGEGGGGNEWMPMFALENGEGS